MNTISRKSENRSEVRTTHGSKGVTVQEVEGKDNEEEEGNNDT